MGTVAICPFKWHTLASLLIAPVHTRIIYDNHMSESEFELRVALASEVPAMYEIEVEAFPEDEAASLLSMSMRCQEANTFFTVLTQMQQESESATLLGYINGTLCEGTELHHESMSEHVPSGTTLVLHSVTIAREYRRKGHARKMLVSYMNRLVKDIALRGVKLVLLLAHEYLLEFYKSCGFTVMGVSPVVHGSDPWYELSFDLEEARRQWQLGT